MSQNEAPYAGSSDPFVIPRDATYRASSSDQEFVDLARKAAENGMSPDDIKKSVKFWRPDHDRV